MKMGSFCHFENVYGKVKRSHFASVVAHRQLRVASFLRDD